MSNKNPIIPGPHPGQFHLPDDTTIVYLNPMERSLYQLFINHPEGIHADALPQHLQELYRLYAHESVFDNKQLMLTTIQNLCGESKITFYTSVSRIKKKFISALGTRKSSPYIIKRDKSGYYKTRATLKKHHIKY